MLISRERSLALLLGGEEGVAEWNRERRAGERIPDLSLANLQGANLCGADLRVANLRGADLRVANLRGANLRGATLEGANLRGANLRRANLTAADLRAADLTEADLTEANLTKVDLTEADLTAAQLSRARLIASKVKATTLAGAVFADTEVRLVKIDAATVALSNWSDDSLRALLDRGAELDEKLERQRAECRATLPAGDQPYPKDQIQSLVALAADRAKPVQRNDELEAEIQPVVSQLSTHSVAKAGDVVLGARLIEVIGSGNFADVWRARPDDGDGSEDIAIKVAQQEKLGLGRKLDAFRTGVAAMRKLSNDPHRPDNVIELLDSDASDTVFSMNLVAARDLEIAGCDWSLEEKLAFFDSLCEAVEFAHRKEIRHRDIKPKNILVTSRRTPVLTDFDIADPMYKGTLSTKSSGTHNYAAPEELIGVGSRELNADIYSLGRILHFLLLETDPSWEDAVPQLVDLDGQPRALVRIIRMCTLRDPTKRYQTVGELLADLRKAVANPDLWRGVGVGVQSPVRIRLGSWFTPAWVTAAAAVLAIGLGAYERGNNAELEPARAVHVGAEGPRIAGKAEFAEALPTAEIDSGEDLWKIARRVDGAAQVYPLQKVVVGGREFSEFAEDSRGHPIFIAHMISLKEQGLIVFQEDRFGAATGTDLGRRVVKLLLADF